MKKLVFCIIALSLCAFTAQDNSLYITRDAHVWFLSQARLENIEAHTHQGQSLINIKTGKIAFSLQIKSFEFKKELMQEHFNERYMESDKYPKATFDGTITNIGKIDLSKPGSYTANVEGDLTMHGVTKHVKATTSIVAASGSISAKSVFKVTVADYKIEIPAQKADNIAPTLDVNVDATYTLKQ